ncbi:unnamed protein product [Urochloa decumbens]|uniref:Uncharacterized protein n=1 Tax=Urochloa decumbens TaxID=240449 RepID=A0ABC9FWP6_9POAL
MASSAAAGLPSVVGARVIRTAASSSPPSPAASSCVHLPAATVAPARGVRLRAAICRTTARVPHLRCAPPGNDAAATTGLDEDDADAAGLPWWAPTSIEELIEFEKAADFSPEAIVERYVRESKEARAAVTGAVAGLLLRPLRELVDDVRKLKTVYEIEEFHIGLPVGAVMSCVALFQLWKAAPAACVDFLLAFAFYRLCVMAADIRRRGYATDMIIRIKLLINVAMLVKGLVEKKFGLLGYLARFAFFGIYFFSVGFEISGLKKYGRYILPMLFDSLKTPEGRLGWIDTLSKMDFGNDYDD